MVKLYTSEGYFEYNGNATVKQLKAYLKFIGVRYGSRILKRDLLHIVNSIRWEVDNCNNDSIPIVEWMLKETPEEKTARMRGTKIEKKSSINLLNNSGTGYDS